jgi:hypothetical protein
VDDLVAQYAEMDCGSLMRQLCALDCDFVLDFTDEFLASLDIEHLRHIVLAAALCAR